MGRSSGYCFKIIACGGSSESVDRDDLDASSQHKGFDKRGWSFRKKSAGHQVLSNTIITEIPSSESKKISEPVISNSEATEIPSVHEKASANQSTEELARESLTTKAADEDAIKVNSTPDESSVIVIQAAIRRFLAQREVSRHKNVVKLQAAIRGHLVRCRAAGTLRCIQAIVKMQALVRARTTKASGEKLSIKRKGIQNSKREPHPTYISIEKLLSNRFANQLLESTPRSKQMNIKCDPSKNDNTWKWMERWMSVSSPESAEPHAAKQEEVNVDNTKTEGKNVILSQCESTDVISEQPKRPAKRVATEEADSDGRKSVFGSRKPSNPSFIVAHSRFEELTSKSKPRESEPLVYESLRVGQSQTGESECGTELSVTSMLDSPDHSDVENTEYEKEAKVLDKESNDNKRVSVEEHALLGTELTHSIMEFQENSKDSQEENASPRSHVTATVTVSEAQGTPSSEVSINKNKTDKKVSGQSQSQKQKTWSNNTKKSSSGLRTSLEYLPREPKRGNRRNSFGSQSSDQEARDSSCSNSIPSYMQVTQSARAKALANNSPRSSPDTQGKEAYMKKRHSLPASSGNGRHGSPRLKRSSPQAQQQTPKGNDNPDRKWQR